MLPDMRCAESADQGDSFPSHSQTPVLYTPGRLLLLRRLNSSALHIRRLLPFTRSNFSTLHTRKTPFLHKLKLQYFTYQGDFFPSHARTPVHYTPGSPQKHITTFIKTTPDPHQHGFDILLDKVYHARSHFRDGHRGHQQGFRQHQ